MVGSTSGSRARIAGFQSDDNTLASCGTTTAGMLSEDGGSQLHCEDRVIRFPEKLEGCSHTGAGLPMSQGYEQRLRMRPTSWTSEFQAEQHLPMISLTVR